MQVYSQVLTYLSWVCFYLVSTQQTNKQYHITITNYPLCVYVCFGLLCVCVNGYTPGISKKGTTYNMTGY